MHHARRRLAPFLVDSTVRCATLSSAAKGIDQVARAGAAGEVGRGLGAGLVRGFATAGGVVQEVPKERGWGRRLGTAVVGIGVVSAAVWVGSGDYPLRRATMLYTIPVRLARDVTTAVAMAAG